MVIKKNIIPSSMKNDRHMNTGWDLSGQGCILGISEKL
jgi:hypothetical protein